MRRSLIGLLFVWTYCLFWAVTPLLGWSSYGPEGVQTSCSLAWEERSWNNYSYLILYTLLCFIFPVGVIIYCYSKVLTAMKKVGTVYNSEPSHLYPLQSEQQKVMASKTCHFYYFLLIAEQERGAPGWAFLPEGEWSRHQHGVGHDNSFLCLLAALHSAVSGGCSGSRASHPSAGGHHAHVLRQDQSRLQPHHLLSFQQAGEQLLQLNHINQRRQNLISGPFLQFRDATLELLSCGRYIHRTPTSVTINMHSFNRRSRLTSLSINTHSKVSPLWLSRSCRGSWEPVNSRALTQFPQILREWKLTYRKTSKSQHCNPLPHPPPENTSF